MPPLITLASIVLGPSATASSRSRPSSISSSAPGLIAAKISGCGSGIALACRPASRPSTKRTVSPAATWILPSSERADPELRTLQVQQNADRPADLALDRRGSAACSWRWSSCVPWLKFSRNTSAPAWNSARSWSGDRARRPEGGDDLGVAWRRMEVLLSRQAAAGWIRMARKSLTLVSVGPVTTESPSASKKPWPSLSSRLLARLEPCAERPGQGVGRQRRRRRSPPAPSIAVGVAGERADAGCAVQRHRQRQQELDVAPAPALAAHGHGGLAAGQQHAGRRHRLAVPRHLAGDAGHDLADLARLALDRVAEDEGRDARGPARRSAAASSAICGVAIDDVSIAGQPRVAGLRRFPRRPRARWRADAAGASMP